MEYTKVFATEQELTDLRQLVSAGWRTGDIVMVTSVMQGITKDQKVVDAKKTCHKIALSHDLPEIEGYYGITEKGEFVST